MSLSSFARGLDNLRSIEEGITGTITSTSTCFLYLNIALNVASTKPAEIIFNTLSVTSYIRSMLLMLKIFTSMGDSDLTPQERILHCLTNMAATGFLSFELQKFNASSALEFLYTGFAGVAVGDFLLSAYNYKKIMSTGTTLNQRKEARNDLIIKTLSVIGWTLLASSQPVGWIFIAATSAYYIKKDIVPAIRDVYQFFTTPAAPAANQIQSQPGQPRIAGIGEQVNQQQPESATGFKAFSGKGHRLGS